jgi:hypothetical protein
MAGILSATKGIGEFQANLRANIRGLWNGELSAGQFFNGMFAAIERGFNQAWAAGAAECGIKPDEYSDEERSILQNLSNDQFPHILSLAEYVQANSKANGGQLAPLFARAALWVARYEEVRNQAKVVSCGNQKLMWTLGIAEHCSSCMKLAGQVRRASFWRASGIWPRQAGSHLLECGGFRCQCSLVPTDAPMSRGRLPSLP